MKLETVFPFEEYEDSLITEGLINEMLFEKVVDSREEAEAIFESLATTINRYASQYSSNEAPTVMAFQDPMVSNHVVVLSAGSGMFFRFDVVNGRVVDEERFSNFRELMSERETLLAERYRTIDHRTFIQRNWKKIIMYVLAGSAAILGAPLLFAVILEVGAVAAYVAKLTAIGAGMGAVGWIANKIHTNSNTHKVPNDPWMR